MERTLDTGLENLDRFMVFNLGKDVYALSLTDVKEVIGFGAVTPVPNAPPYFKGVLNLRDHVISIVDLGQKLRGAEIKSAERAIIVLDVPSHHIGILVDGVESVIKADKDMMQPPPVTTDQKSECVRGIIREQQRLILLLDINEALSLQTLTALHKSVA